MLTAHLIHDDEDFPAPLRAPEPVYAISLREFHHQQRFFDAIHLHHGAALSYFSDAVLRSATVADIAGPGRDIFMQVGNPATRAELTALFDRALHAGTGLVFICD